MNTILIKIHQLIQWYFLNILNYIYNFNIFYLLIFIKFYLIINFLIN